MTTNQRLPRLTRPTSLSRDAADTRPDWKQAALPGSTCGTDDQKHVPGDFHMLQDRHSVAPLRSAGMVDTNVAAAAGGVASTNVATEPAPLSADGPAPAAIGANRAPGREPRQRPGRRLASLTSAVIVIASLVCIAVSLPGAWIMLGTLLIGLSITARRTASGEKLLTILLCLAVGATAVDYLTWRLEVTNWDGWWIAAPLLAAEIFGALHTVGLQYTVWPWPQPLIVPSEDPTFRPIFIFIPTVNEGQAVLAPTIQAAIEARRRYLEAFPHGRVLIVVCNDGRVANAANWGETESLARRLGVACITRTVVAARRREISSMRASKCRRQVRLCS